MEGILYYTDKFVDIQYNKEQNWAMVKAKTSFIPEQEFRKVFNEKLKQLIADYYIRCLIFDKTALTVFDQPSMTWYHVDWKVRMLKEHGLKYHFKILPQDQYFRISVELGKKKIAQEHPNFSFSQFEIHYTETVEEAIEACKTH